jgi:hypothetical protein
MRELFDRLLDNSWRLLQTSGCVKRMMPVWLVFTDFRRKLDAHVAFKYILLNMKTCLTTKLVLHERTDARKTSV